MHLCSVFSIFLLSLLSVGWALDCYICTDPAKCKDPVDVNDLGTQTCGAAPPAAAAAGGEEATTAAARRRRDDETTAAADGAAAGAGAGAAAGPFMCLKMYGFTNGTDTNGIWRGCGTDCDTQKPLLSITDGSCEQCEEDKCNNSINVKPLAWLFLLLASVPAMVQF